MTPDWHREAVCAQVGPHVFYPEKGEDTEGYVRQAKAMCAACPVREACLRDALSGEHGQYGIWGGTTPAERARMLGKKRSGQKLYPHTHCEACGGELPENRGRNQRFHKDPACQRQREQRRWREYEERKRQGRAAA